MKITLLKFLLLTTALGCGLLRPRPAAAQSVIDYTGGTLTENFDGLGPAGTNTPPGWFVGYVDSTNLTNVAVSDGGVAPNQTAGWNFGISNGTNRALGTMATTSNTTGTPPPPAGSRYVEVRIRNSTTQNLSSITVSYDGEQWRTGSTTNTVNMLVLQYSADGSNYVDMGAAFNFTQRTFTPLNSALNGNDPANRVAKIPPDGEGPYVRVIPPDGTIFLRWFNPGGPGADAALAIDNFTFSAQFPPPLVNCACLDMLPALRTTVCRALIPDLCQFTQCWLSSAALVCAQSPPAGGSVGPGTTPITITYTHPSSGQKQICTVNFVVTAPPEGCGCPCPTNNLIVNGSFETGNVIAPGGCENLPPATLPGWTVVNSSINRCFTGASGVTASAGNMFLDLTGPSDTTPHGVTQTVPTIPGQCYKLTFDLGVKPDTKLLAGPITVKITVDNTWKAFTYNPTGPPGTTVWNNYSFLFTTGPSPTVITIEGVSGQGFIGLDNVALVCSCECTNVCFDCPPLQLTVQGCPPLVPDFSNYSFACANGAPFGPLTVTQNPPAGTTLLSGTTVVIVNVLDALGNSRSCDVVLNAVFTPGCPLCPCRTNNLIVNGSFEDGNAIPFGSCDNLPPSTMPGWTVGTLQINRCQTGASGVTASDGTLFLDLTGPNDTTGGAVTQTVPTTIGQCYKLTFDLGVKQDNPILAGPITVKVTAGAYTLSFTHTAPPGSGTVWNNYGYLFTAFLANTPVTIEGVSGVGYIGLDNVALVCSCDCPPRPCSDCLPPIDIINNSTNILLSWPASVPGYSLEETGALLGTNTVWTAVTNSPAVVEGNHQVTLPLSRPKGFYRLKQTP